jgi:hypothetical protein
MAGPRPVPAGQQRLTRARVSRDATVLRWLRGREDRQFGDRPAGRTAGNGVGAWRGKGGSPPICRQRPQEHPVRGARGRPVLGATISARAGRRVLRPLGLLRLMVRYGPKITRGAGSLRSAITHLLNVRRYARRQRGDGRSRLPGAAQGQVGGHVPAARRAARAELRIAARPKVVRPTRSGGGCAAVARNRSGQGVEDHA